MRSKIKIFIFVVLFLALFNGIYFFVKLKNSNNNSQKIDAESLEKKEELHPLMIEALRKREYKSQEIKVEKNLGDKGKYKNYIVSYDSDGLKLYALLSIPNDSTKKKFPVVIVDHGHIPPEKYSTENSYRLVSGYYASNGFLVLKPDYRGHDKSEGTYDPVLTRLSYSIDVLNLLASISSIKEADTDNIFIYGHSMGGGITLTVLEVSGKIKAATLWAAVSNGFPENTLYFRRKHSADEAKELLTQIKGIFKEEDFSKLSPNNYLQDIKVPVLIQHGKKDESVPYQWSLDLIEKFKVLGISYKFYSYEDEDHNFSKKYFYTVLKRDVDFFKNYIK